MAGDTMIACTIAGGYAGGGGTLTFTPDPAWDPVYGAPDAVRVYTNLYTKVAAAVR